MAFRKLTYWPTCHIMWRVTLSSCHISLTLTKALRFKKTSRDHLWRQGSLQFRSERTRRGQRGTNSILLFPTPGALTTRVEGLRGKKKHHSSIPLSFRGLSERPFSWEQRVENSLESQGPRLTRALSIIISFSEGHYRLGIQINQTSIQEHVQPSLGPSGWICFLSALQNLLIDFQS